MKKVLIFYWDVGCEVRNANYELKITNYGLRVTIHD